MKVADDVTTQRLNAEGVDPLVLAGVNDANLLELGRQTGTRVNMRGDLVSIVGSSESVERAAAIAQRMIDAARQKQVLDADDVLRIPTAPEFLLPSMGTGPSPAVPAVRTATKPRSMR